MSWAGYIAAKVSDPTGVEHVLQVYIARTPERDKQSPSMRAELAHVIEIESAWRPDIVNPDSGATGLIQFTKETAVELGTTVQALRKMSRSEQTEYVQAYFDKVAKTASKQGDVYLMVFSPAFVGHEDHEVIFPVGTKAWKQNPGLRAPGDGPITVGRVRSIGIAPGELPDEGGQLPPPPSKPPKGKPPKGKPSKGGGGSLLLLALAWYFWKKRKRR